MVEVIRSTQALPESYKATWKLDMRERKNLLIANLAALAILFIITPLIFAFASSVRPNESYRFSLTGVSGLLDIFVLVIVLALMLLVHEGIHGIFIWIFTGTRPKFALKVYYAYAAAPGWYLAKWPYFITAIAPLVVITALGLIAMTFVPLSWVFAMMLLVIFNASGAVGDAWVALALLKRKPSVFAQDDGDVVTFYESV